MKYTYTCRILAPFEKLFKNATKQHKNQSISIIFVEYSLRKSTLINEKQYRILQSWKNWCRRDALGGLVGVHVAALDYDLRSAMLRSATAAPQNFQYEYTSIRITMEYTILLILRTEYNNIICIININTYRIFMIKSFLNSTVL